VVCFDADELCFDVVSVCEIQLAGQADVCTCPSRWERIDSSPGRKRGSE
jgi:hypothetical protein